MNTVDSTEGTPHQIILVLDDDLMMTEGLAAGLERKGRTLVTCNDVESGEMMVDWLGIRYAQGYYFSKPADVSAFVS